MSTSSDDRNPVERLAEDFLTRHRRGDHPHLTEYVGRHPEWAEEIRELFPTLLMMEGLKPAEGDVTGPFIEDGTAESRGIPERLGDFRILREVGRGGMGIVYEAVQESLGRHVALKVLLSHDLLNPRHLQRFLREARAAARLHHTHIVPVFGVGEGNGLHYYVMQFISGSGLHEVIDELRRVKSAAQPTAADLGQTPARSSLAFLVEPVTGLAPPRPATAEVPHPSGSSIVGGAGSILSESGRDFAKEVARLGIQVAEALGYAHGEGVLHRDIKPSNLLLDGKGTLWVADFGLAKAAADGDDLTIEGDFVGTIRYMAPERFRGQADARSDLYALGLTLYELLTLRPAFDQQGRERLILQVSSEVPPRPRTINPEIPRDLETIVLKAIEHDPARRYQGADDLAEDLKRFVADLPITARRVGVVERTWMWAQRKPAIAGLLAALALALVVGFAGTTWQWRMAVAASRVARHNETKARVNFAHALETVNTFCTQVSQEELLDQPGMQPLRRRLLGLAQTYYQTFQRQRDDDPGLARDLALTFVRSGVLTNELGDGAAAHIALLRAKDILRRLHRGDPKDAGLSVQLARCCIEIEDADRVNDFANAGGTFYDSKLPVEIMKPLAAGHPGNLEYLRLLGRGHDVYGVQQFRRGRYADAEASLRSAVATLERAYDAAPDDLEAGRWLALAHVDLGLVAQQVGRHASHAQALERARAILGAMEGRAPAVRRHRLDLAQCLVSLGDAGLDLGRYREAEAHFREAHDRLSRLYREDPEAVDVRHWLAVAKQGLGRTALARGQGSAGTLLREAIALYESAPARSLAGRDLLALAWSFLWLNRAELQQGHPEAVLPLHRRLAEAIGEFKGQLLLGTTFPRQSSALAQIEARVRSLLASARAATLPERVAAQEQEAQARRGLANAQPDNPALRSEAAWEVIQLADLLSQDGQAGRARSSLTLAFALLGDQAGDDPADLRRRQCRARAWETLARVQPHSGPAAEARPAAEKAVSIAEDLARVDPAYAYDRACALTLRGTLSSSETDATAAIAALRLAIENGFDNDHLLGTDPRLDRLRSRPDFPAPIGSTDESR